MTDCAIYDQYRWLKMSCPSLNRYVSERRLVRGIRMSVRRGMDRVSMRVSVSNRDVRSELHTGMHVPKQRQLLHSGRRVFMHTRMARLGLPAALPRRDIRSLVSWKLLVRSRWHVWSYKWYRDNFNCCGFMQTLLLCTILKRQSSSIILSSYLFDLAFQIIILDLFHWNETYKNQKRVV